MKQKMLTILVVLIAHLLVFQSAQAYPDRPIKLVVPSPAGGPPDQIARLISDKMAAALGQPVIVENRTGGAGGIIGAKSVATAEPDGYTLFMGRTSSVLIAPLIYKKCRLHRRDIRARRSCRRDHRNARAASFRTGQHRGGIGRPGEVAAGRAELWVGRRRDASAS